MSSQELRVKLQEAINKFESSNFDSLRRHDLPENIRFDWIVDEFLLNMQEMLNCIPENVYSSIPTQRLDNLYAGVSGLNSVIERIRTFEIGNGNPIEIKNSIERNCENIFFQLYDSLTPHLGRIALTSRQGKTEREIREHFEQFLTESTQRISEQEKRLTETLQAARIAAGIEGVQQEAEHFRVAAESHRMARNRWLFATWGSVFFLVVFAVGFPILGVLQDYMVAKMTPEAIQIDSNIRLWNLTIAKVFVFASLTFGLFFCSRSYFAHAHNVTLNEHREVALRTYRALVNAAHGAEQRDIVLAHAASCIFSPQPTAFVRDSTSAPAEFPLIQTIEKVLSRPS